MVANDDPRRILLIEVDGEERDTLVHMLQDHGFGCLAQSNVEEALQLLQTSAFDILLTELNMLQFDGKQLLQQAHAIDPDLMAIIIKDQGTVEEAVDYLKKGAFDFVLKPLDMTTLLPVLERACAVRKLRQENIQLRDTIALFDLLKALSATLEVDRLLDLIASAAAQQCEADEVSVLLPTSRGHDMCICAVRGPRREELLGTRVSMDKGIAGWVAKNLETVVLNGSVHDERFAPLNPRSDIRASVSMPMLASGKLIGILNVNVVNSYRPFTPGQMKALQFLAGTGASALDRALLHQQLGEAEAKYRSIFENSADGIYQADERGKLTTVNSTLARLLGYTSPAELLREAKNFGAPLFIDDIGQREFADIVARQQSHQFEARLRCKDGSKIWTWISARPVRGLSGIFEHFEGSIKDISDRKKLEENFLQAQKMDAIGRLAGGVAHDFNNLLTVINGYADLLKTLLPKENSSRHCLDEIQKAGERGASLTRQLLAFSRKQVVAPKVIDLNAVVTETEKLLRRLIGEDIELITNLQPELPGIKADPSQIDQILVNLAVNARDAMPQGGRLTIATDGVDIDDDRRSRPIDPVASLDSVNNPHVRLSVTDDGTGMEPEVLDKIFEPFFTTKVPGKGTGLGLATVFSIVQQSGGFIQVRSKPGDGSTFHLYFPSAREALAPRAPKPDSTPDSMVPINATLLLVEDDDGVRWLARCILEERGIRVLDARSGEEALEVCSEFSDSIDMVLTDLILPGMSGRRLADYLMSVRPKTRMLFMSGYFDDSLSQHGIAELGIPLLEKPFTPENLVRQVRKTLQTS